MIEVFGFRELGFRAWGFAFTVVFQAVYRLFDLEQANVVAVVLVKICKSIETRRETRLENLGVGLRV